MFEETCCVCKIRDAALVQLWRGVYACHQHTREEILRAPLVFEKLRTLEVRYYQEMLKSPGAIVWASRSLAEFRVPADGEPRLALPDNLPVLMIPDNAFPEMFAIDDVLADVFLSIFKGRYHSPVELLDLGRKIGAIWGMM